MNRRKTAPSRGAGAAMNRGFTAVEARAIEEFLIDLDPRQAAARSGLPVSQAFKFFSESRVLEAIALARRRRLSRLELYSDEILRRWVALASADPRELVELRRVNCRNCHGIDHEYRFDDVEHRAAFREHHLLQLRRLERDRVPFDERGGSGFRPNDPPDPDCPKCGGDGVPRVIVKDTRGLSPAAVLLYDGVKVGAGGSIEVKLRDRGFAEMMIARHAGMFAERRRIEEFDPSRLSDDQLDAVVTALVERGSVELEGEISDAAEDLSDPEATEVKGSPDDEVDDEVERVSKISP